MENNELKDYYDQHYNKDGQGPPFEQLTEQGLEYVAEGLVFYKKMRNHQRELNILLIKEVLKSNQK